MIRKNSLLLLIWQNNDYNFFKSKKLREKCTYHLLRDAGELCAEVCEDGVPDWTHILVEPPHLLDNSHLFSHWLT